MPRRSFLKGIISSLSIGMLLASHAVPCDAQTRVARQAVAQAATPQSISRARLQQVLGGAGARLRVVRASGVRDLPASSTDVSIAPGEFVFRKISDTAQRERPNVPGAATYIMPYRWLTVDAAGVVRVLKPSFTINGGGLTYHAGSREYRGTALVGVEDSLNAGDGPVPLVRPLKLQLTTTMQGAVTPARLEIDHTSLDYEPVTIVSPDSNYVRVRTGADTAGIVIRVPVHRVKVSLTPQQTSLQGLGLATTDIGVSLPPGLTQSDTVEVTFSSTSAPVRPAMLRLSGARGSSVRLRSGRIGDNTIRAYVDGVEVGSTVVRSDPPLEFLTATIVGIVLGGLIRFVSAKRRKRARALTWDILKGAPVGFLTAVAGAIGLDLLQLKLDEPGALPAVMVTAALGAWAGAKILDRGSPASAT